MSFVPENFTVPPVLETPLFRLRMLSVQDVEKDYDAVITSKEHLRTVFHPSDTWPAEDISLSDNLNDLNRHQLEFLNRQAFAYTVFSPDETACLGCVYINPSKNTRFDAAVFMWVRKSELEKGLDEKLFTSVKTWLKESWPFQNPAYPGREIHWDDWLASLPCD